jgi:putative spermidine/putrescine transport system ATP-binding protein
VSDAAHLSVRGVRKQFGKLLVIDALDFAVNKGELVSLLGPSGCGKTTLLRMIAGLVRADRGSIMLGGRELTRLAPNQRNLGVVFQDYALFPHLTVAQNVAFGLKARRAAAGEIRAAVAHHLDMVRMAEFADRPVTMLSGGQQQRVAVARALAIRPDLMLLDEPFSALDRKLREHMQVELRQLLREVGITTIFVTHDQHEALVMSDRMAVMQGGRIEQFADPATVYAEPSSLFVLEFVGMSTRIAGRVIGGEAGTVQVESPLGALRARGGFAPGSKVVVGIRPENIQVGTIAEGAENRFNLPLLDSTHLGSRRLFRFDVGAAGEVIAEVPSNLPPPAFGSVLPVGWMARDAIAFTA